MTDLAYPEVGRTPTGIEGLEALTRGGLPTGRMTVVSGTAGSGKTVFSAQFLAEGIRRYDEVGLFVSLDQGRQDLLSNLGGFAWGLPGATEDGRFILLDASPAVGQAEVVTGEYDLDGLLVRIRHAVASHGVRRVAVDAVNTLAENYDPGHLRTILRRLRALFSELDVTAVVTTERLSEDQPELTRYGLESFVGDAVIVLRNNPIAEYRRRTIEVVKVRGGGHHAGQVPFAILPGRGIAVLPLTTMPLDHPRLGDHISCGIPALDEMLGGGVRRSSVTLAAGPTGSGKTLLSCSFADAGLQEGERVLYVSFEESPEQLIANAAGIGLEALSLGSADLLVISRYPESRGAIEHLLGIHEAIDTFGPDRLIVDGLAALENLTPDRVFREFLIGLNSRVKAEGLTAWYTMSLPLFYDRGPISMANLSSMADNLLLTRYEHETRRTRRTLAVVKTRGSQNDASKRSMEIGSDGIRIGPPPEEP